MCRVWRSVCQFWPVIGTEELANDQQRRCARAALRPAFHFYNTGGLGEVPQEAAVVVDAVAIAVASGVVCVVGDEPPGTITIPEPLAVDAQFVARRVGSLVHIYGA